MASKSSYGSQGGRRVLALTRSHYGSRCFISLAAAQVEVDDNARILRERSARPKNAQAHAAAVKHAGTADSRPETSSGSPDIIPNLYATGLGFGLPAVYGAKVTRARASAPGLERA